MFRILYFLTVPKMQRNKTDKADARLIADFCLTQNPPQWFPPPPQVAQLQALTRRIEALEEMLAMERNRLEVAPVTTQPSITRIITTFEKEIASLQKSIKEHHEQNPDLKSQRQLLETIPGIGEKRRICCWRKLILRVTHPPAK